MKQILGILSGLLFIGGCTSFNDGHPYQEVLQTMSVQSLYPEGYEGFVRQGVQVKAQEISNGNTYVAVTDASGLASFSVPHGIYRVSVTDRANSTTVFNGALEEVRLVVEDLTLTMPLIYSRAGTIVFKELYFGGCSKAPLEGTLFFDQYVILHNNDKQTQYLDGLCFGALDPSVASATNNWVKKGENGELIFQDFAPMYECIWRFPGSGSDFPLAPGEDAVLAVGGAIDFSAQFPLSVNLNKSDYFVCFSRVNFPSEKNPNPGDQIQAARILQVPKQTGAATKDKAYFMGITSPCMVLFRPETGFDLDAYLADDSRCLATAPGSSNKCVKVPWDWIVDGVEAFYGANNNKRMIPSIDAGAFKFSANFKGRTLYRKLDQAASDEAGFAICEDTNNSSNDFYERETQSLHE